MSAESLQHFASIANEFPDSSLAPEANFHIGKTAYHENDLAKAIAAYQKCVAAEGSDSGKNPQGNQFIRLIFEGHVFSSGVRNNWRSQTNFSVRGELDDSRSLSNKEAKLLRKRCVGSEILRFLHVLGKKNHLKRACSRKEIVYNLPGNVRI